MEVKTDKLIRKLTQKSITPGKNNKIQEQGEKYIRTHVSQNDETRLPNKMM